MKQNTNSFTRIEGLLYGYRNLELKANNLDIEIRRLNNEVSMSSASFDEKSAPTNAFSSRVENDVIVREENNLQSKIKHLELLKDNTLLLKEQIDNALKCLSDVERELVRIRYFSPHKIKWVSVAMTLGYDEGYCRKLRRKIIEQLINYIPNV